MAFILTMSATPIIVGAIGSLGVLAAGYYGSSTEIHHNNNSENTKTISDELANFDIKSLKKVIIKDESSKDESSKDESSKDESSKDESSKDESSKDECTDKFHMELKNFHLNSLKKPVILPKKIVEVEHQLTNINKAVLDFHAKKKNKSKTE